VFRYLAHKEQAESTVRLKTTLILKWPHLKSREDTVLHNVGDPLKSKEDIVLHSVGEPYEHTSVFFFFLKKEDTE